MPSAANAKSEKPASSEAADNTPVRQILTIIEHKIRNLEKRKSKLTQYRDLQKAGKELKGDQRVAVAKYDEVAQTLEFARDLSKQVASIAVAAERDAKKQAKKDAWVRNATETSKIREVLLILDCLMQMGNHEARDDFLNGSNGAAKLTEEDLKILDDLYPEVTPKHEPNEEGQPGFHAQSFKAAEHLCSIIDSKPKEIIGTTYSRIKEIVSTVHECGYFDRVAVEAVAVVEEKHPASEEPPEEAPAEAAYPPAALPVPPAPAVVPAPAYPLRPLPPITLQEVEHAYFAQQYPQQRPISEVIGSQNFFFLQESEIDSPVGTPQPPPIPGQASPPGAIPTQTFTNQHFIQMGPRGPEPMPPHFAPHHEHAGYPPAPLAMLPAVPAHVAPPSAALPAPPVPAPAAPATHERADTAAAPSPADNKPDDDWIETRSPEREDGERKTQGDGQGRFRRFGRGGGRGAPNGHRGRGSYQGRQGGDGYQGRQDGYQGRQGGDGYQGRQGGDGYQGRQGGEGYRGRHGGDYQGRPRQYDGHQNRHGKDSYQSRGGDDNYYGNGDTSEGHRDREHNENGGRERREYSEGGQAQSYSGGFKGRGRGGPPRAPRGGSRPPRSHHYNNNNTNNRKTETVE